MGEDEFADRLVQCSRLFDAWPNARPIDRDSTLREYVNVTRGMDPGELSRCIDLCIASGGEFMPPAGQVIHRALDEKIALDGPDDSFWVEKVKRELLAAIDARRSRVAPVIPGADQSVALMETHAQGVALLPAGAEQ